MHINLYLDDGVSERLKTLAKRRGETRNDLIRKALQEWLDSHAEPDEWPQEIINFQGMPEMEAFESHRHALRLPTEDILASRAGCGFTIPSITFKSD